MNDINVSYRDMGQVSGRVDQLRAESRKAARLIDKLTGVLAEKREMLGSCNGESVQLECEIHSVEHKLKELEKRRKAQKKAADCCRMYGIFGLDYSVSADRLYYMGKPVKYFSDPDGGRQEKDGLSCAYENRQEDGPACAYENRQEDGPACAYEDQQGEVSVMAVRGSTGHVLYLKVYDYKSSLSDAESSRRPLSKSK